LLRFEDSTVDACRDLSGAKLVEVRERLFLIRNVVAVAAAVADRSWKNKIGRRLGFGCSSG
jgi:hypothetical protein